MNAAYSISPEKISAATEALGAKKGSKAKHMHIEPSDNKGFITHITDHVDGMPVGRTEHHVHKNVADLVKHVTENYKDNALDEVEAKAKESVAGSTKESKSVQQDEGETDS